jgi:hypothetical protein
MTSVFREQLWRERERLRETKSPNNPHSSDADKAEALKILELWMRSPGTDGNLYEDTSVLAFAKDSMFSEFKPLLDALYVDIGAQTKVNDAPGYRGKIARLYEKTVASHYARRASHA